MKIFTKKNHGQPVESDRIPNLIARAILKGQTAIAHACARNFNVCSLKKKKIIFLTVTSLIAGLLLGGIFFNGYTIPALKLAYKPATHIGLASDINNAVDRNAQLTDSLTTNH
jgi:hypothetical protein